MKKYILVIFMFLLSVLSACSNSEVSAPVQETGTEETPSTQAPVSDSLKFYPLDTRTGNDTIDIVLSAVASGDTQELVKLFSYTRIACRTVNALGGPPPCREGEAEGILVEVLPSLSGEGSYLRKTDVGNFPGLNVIGLYAVYEVSDSAYQDEYFPAGDHGIALIGGDGAPDIVLQVRNEGIVRIDYIFDAHGSGLAEVLERNAANLIIPPAFP
ncbi:MAG TPA: hypothetical protein VJ022_11900 [Anaerolineales bacterium]|nr:hypothetical protein [Anaerolineales bacterium]